MSTETTCLLDEIAEAAETLAAAVRDCDTDTSDMSIIELAEQVVRQLQAADRQMAMLTERLKAGGLNPETGG